MNVLVAALITPPAIRSTSRMMAVPMIVFYEIGILLARILGKRKAEPVGAAAAQA